MIDGLAAALAFVLLVSGWHTGSVYQLGQTVTVFMGALIARAVSLPLARFLVDVQRATDPDRAVGTAFLIAFVAVYGLLWFSVLRLTAELRDAHDRGPHDRFFGAAVGALRGGVMALVVAVGVMTMTFDRAGAETYEIFDHSRVGQAAIDRDFLSPFADKLEEEMNEAASRADDPRRDWDVHQEGSD